MLQNIYSQDLLGKFTGSYFKESLFSHLPWAKSHIKLDSRRKNKNKNKKIKLSQSISHLPGEDGKPATSDFNPSIISTTKKDKGVLVDKRLNVKITIAKL